MLAWTACTASAQRLAEVAERGARAAAQNNILKSGHGFSLGAVMRVFRNGEEV
jgi:hypothetical protein